VTAATSSTEIENDGEFIKAQFVRENGEVVIGEYQFVGWNHAPQAVRDDVNERLREPPLQLFGAWRRG
jgi:hypothetical protein